MEKRKLFKKNEIGQTTHFSFSQFPELFSSLHVTVFFLGNKFHGKKKVVQEK